MGSSATAAEVRGGAWPGSTGRRLEKDTAEELRKSLSVFEEDADLLVAFGLADNDMDREDRRPPPSTGGLWVSAVKPFSTLHSTRPRTSTLGTFSVAGGQG
jgi:hypothetical protein